MTHYDYDYDNDGYEVTVTLAGIYTTRSNYNGLGQLLQESRPGDGPNILTDYQYDLLGRLQSVSTPYAEGDAPVYTTYDYDVLNRPTDITNIDGTTRHIIYQDGNRILERNEAKQWTEQRFDSRGRLTATLVYSAAPSTSPPSGGSGGLYTTTRYDYDQRDNLNRITLYDGNNVQLAPAITMTTNSLGQQRAMFDPDMGHWSYDYDNNGNLISQIDGRNETIDFSYDALNRLITKTDNDELNISYNYDEGNFGKGQRTAMLDKSGQTTWMYDPLGRVLSETKTYTNVNSGMPRFTTDYSYNALNRIQNMTYPDGEVISYTYNTQGFVSQMSSSWGQDYLSEANFTVQDQVDSMTLGNGVKIGYNYNSATNPAPFQLANLWAWSNSELLQNLTFSAYDHLGNLIQVYDAQRQTTTTYSYDPLARLINADYLTSGLPDQRTTYTYTYNALGNLTSRQENSNIWQLTYPGPTDPQPHAPLQLYQNNVLTRSFLYDDNGNRDNDGDQEYTYNSENRLIKISDNGVDIAFTYNGHGQQVKKDIDSNDPIEILNVGPHYEINPNTWTDPVKISNSPFGNELRLLHDNTGSLHLLWSEENPQNEDGYALYYAYRPPLTTT